MARTSMCMTCARSSSRQEQYEAGVEENVCPKCGGQLLYAYRGRVGSPPGNRRKEALDIYENPDMSIGNDIAN